MLVVERLKQSPSWGVWIGSFPTEVVCLSFGLLCLCILEPLVQYCLHNSNLSFSRAFPSNCGGFSIVQLPWKETKRKFLDTLRIVQGFLTCVLVMIQTLKQKCCKKPVWHLSKSDSRFDIFKKQKLKNFTHQQKCQKWQTAQEQERKKKTK